MSNKSFVLITGGTGLLGVNWAICRRNLYNVTLGIHDRYISIEDVCSRKIAYSSKEKIFSDIKNINPKYLVHAAGYTNVELCEKSPELAKSINVSLTEIIADICAHLNIKMIYISTDHLFSGENKFYNETDDVHPVNVYAKSKAEAELKVLNICEDSIVVRTNFYGWGTSYRQSFSDFIITSLRTNKEISLYKDVFYTPILIESLVNIIDELILKDVSGVFNVAGSNRLSKYDFGQAVAEVFKLDKNRIKPVSLADNNTFVKRPLDMSLSIKKTEEVIGKSILGIDADLARLRQQENVDAIKEIKSL